MTPKNTYAEVAPCIPLPSTSPQTYTYRLPADLMGEIPVYSPVTIPFGRRQVLGIVTRLHAEDVAYPTKFLTPLAPVQLTVYQYQFAQWLSETLQSGLGYTLRLFLPPLPKKLKTASWPVDVAGQKSSIQTPRVIIEKNFSKRVNLVFNQVKKVISNGQQVLLLVPEVWMVGLWAEMAEKHWPGQVQPVHTDLTPKAIREAWFKVRDGHAKLVVGTQKALFFPYSSLGLVIIEEEHSPTHKLWDQYPRLDNRYGAKKLAELSGAQFLLSASVESLSVLLGRSQDNFEVLKEDPLPIETRIIVPSNDDRKQKRLLPDELIGRLRAWLKRGQRVVVLHQARGDWQTLFCRHCERAVSCPDCQVALTVHRQGGHERLECHHCGFTTTIPLKCPSCDAKDLIAFGAGVEKVAQLFEKVLPKKYKVVSIDAETKAVDISDKQLIFGTSAIFSALRQETVDQAVWLFPERGLLYPDFRSEERARYMLARLQSLLPAKRKVTIATRQNRLALQALALSDEAWKNRQLKERKRLGYPPYADLVRLTFHGQTPAQAADKAAKVRQQLEERLQQSSAKVTLRGPFKSFIQKRRGFAEVHIILLGALADLVPLYHGLAIDFVDLAPEKIL